MSVNEKDSEKIFCLFHQKIDCLCIVPVTNNKKLEDRLNHSISLNNILNRTETDLALKEMRSSQNDQFASRLENLRM